MPVARVDDRVRKERKPHEQEVRVVDGLGEVTAPVPERRQRQEPYAGLDRRAMPAFSPDYRAGFAAAVAAAAELNDSHARADPAYVSRLIRALTPEPSK